MRRTSEYTEFGMWLKIELMKRNLTSHELASMAGLDFRVVTDVMVGRNKSHKDEIRMTLERYDREQIAV
ncbi:MAG: hypothetical protein PHY47_16135 [Lachnospiraceae bacterium]|nr:hypothetical protein [Lachnospiraceae bacterium]